MRPRFDYRGFMFDLDGTVYLGERLLPGAQAAVAALRAAGRRLSASRTSPSRAAPTTRSSSTPRVPTDVEAINSSYVLARWLDRETPGARVFVIGEPPLIAELEQAGLKPVDGPEADWVVVAFDRTFDYRKLDVALQAVTRHGRAWSAPTRTGPARSRTGISSTLRDDRGGRGRHRHEGRADRGQAVADHARGGAGAAGLTAGECAIVGDRLETDIAMGKAAGAATILVLTGITRAGDPAIARWQPDHVLASLEDLLT